LVRDSIVLSRSLWTCLSSHISGCSEKNLLVGMPRRMTPPSSSGGTEASTPLSTCSTELFVGAKTATLSPALRHPLMADDSTNWVFPVPGAPQTYESFDESSPSAAILCSSVGVPVSG